MRWWRGKRARIRVKGQAGWLMRLPFPWILALRYLKSSRRDAYVSLLSWLATGGITLGVGALILVLAGLSGMQGFLRSDVLSRTPHLEIELPPKTAGEAIRAELAQIEGVVEAHQLIRGRGWLLLSGSALDVEVVGYEGSLPAFFPDPREVSVFVPPGADQGIESEDLRAKPGDGSATTTQGGQGVYLGDVVAIRWGLQPGDIVEVVSGRPTLTPFGPQPRIRQLRLQGTFRTGRTEEDKPRLAVPLDIARRLFGDRQVRLEVQGADLDSALDLAATIAPLLPEGSRLRTWQDLNRGLFFALKLEKILMFLSVFLIVPVAAMSLITVLALLISSKKHEIGMLQAMGAQPNDVRRAFLFLGGMLVVIGVIGGGTLGVGGAWLLDRFKIITPPGNVYLMDHVPFIVEPRDLAAVLGATVVFTVLSTLYAARKAASTEPVEALRR